MKLRKSMVMRSTLKKDFVELEIPDEEFIGMKEGDTRLYLDKNNNRIVLEIFKGLRWALFITGYQSFEEKI